MIIKFGKYKNYTLDELIEKDKSYVLWLESVKHSTWIEKWMLDWFDNNQDKLKLAEDRESMFLKFGKYTGKELSTLPCSYLFWLSEQSWFVKKETNKAYMDFINKNYDEIVKKKSGEQYLDNTL